MSQPHPLITRLKAERERQKIPAAALARRAGYTREALANWEKGRAVPDLDRLDDLAAALGLRIALMPADHKPAITPTEGNR